MPKSLRLIFFSISLMFIICRHAYASHIVGGELSYSFVSYNQDRTIVNYEVTLKLYRDPKGIDYDNFADFGIFVEESSGQWKSYDVILDIPIGNQEEIPRDTDPCKLRSLNEERLQSAVYQFPLSLEVGQHNYLISYQKCCRNFTINNIYGGGEIGSVYDITITPEAQRNGNSSPSFVDLPPIFICAGYDIDVKNAAVDAEGDQLVYSFCTPLHSGTDMSEPGCCGCQDPDPTICLPPYQEASYVEQYNAQSPLGDPLMSVDPLTGTIDGVPAFTGSYVVAVCLEEYRNGVLLSRTRRDFEFNVVTCVENLTAIISSDEYIFDEQVSATDSIAYFETCHQTDIEFENLSGDLVFIQDYEWQFYDSENNLLLLENGLELRDYTMNFPGPGSYSGLMILNDGISCHDTAYMSIKIIPEFDNQISIQFDSCVAGPVSFEARATATDELSWSWNTGDGNVYTEQTFQHEYDTRGQYSIELVAEDTFGCKQTLTQELAWYPHELIPPDTIKTELFICESDSLFIYDNWVKQYGIYYDYIPSFWTGCDSIVQEIILNILPIENQTIRDTICMGDTRRFGISQLVSAGIYEDTLQNMMGCDSIVFLDLTVAENLAQINIDERLIAEYGSTVYLETEVRAENLILTEWYKNGVIIGDETELTFVAKNDDWIFFESVDDLFCVSTDSIFIKTIINRQVFFPNAITPDGDGVNDVFNVGASETVMTSQVSIFDRWGKLIYIGEESEDRQIETGWDGTYEGRPVKNGVYVYKAIVKYIDGEQESYQGDVSVIR